MGVYIKADQRFWREGAVLIPHGFMHELETAVIEQEESNPASCSAARDFYDYAYSTLWFDEGSEWPEPEEGLFPSKDLYRYGFSYQTRFAGVFGKIELGLLERMARESHDKVAPSEWGGWGMLGNYREGDAWSLKNHEAFGANHWFVSALPSPGNEPASVESSPGEMERGTRILQEMDAKLKAALPWISATLKGRAPGALPFLRSAKGFSQELSSLAKDLPKGPLSAFDDEGLLQSRYAEQSGWAVFVGNAQAGGFVTSGSDWSSSGTLAQAALFESEAGAKRSAASRGLRSYALVEVAVRVKSIGLILNTDVDALRGAISSQEKKELDEVLKEQELDAARAAKQSPLAARPGRAGRI